MGVLGLTGLDCIGLGLDWGCGMPCMKMWSCAEGLGWAEMASGDSEMSVTCCEECGMADMVGGRACA